MSIVKPKISSIASSRLPEFIQEDYQTFVAFIEAYYEFLDQNILVDFDSINDIDTTLDSFIQYFKNELALNFPVTQIDDRFLLPKLKELYTSKGSEASYKLLFRLLYNKEIDIIFPSKQMLRVSDGKWIQDKSIFVNISAGTPDTIVGQTIKIVTENKKISAYVDRYQTTSNSNIYEFFISNWIGDFYVGNTVQFSSTFVGSIVSIPTKVSVLQSGKNFKVGQIYPIDSSTTGALIKILKVDKNGGILSAQVIDFSIGYGSNFTCTLSATTYQSTETQNYFTLTGGSPNYNVGINDSITSLNDTGSINKYDYADSTYVDNSYVGSIITSFSDNSSTNGTLIVDQTNFAIVSITLGPLATYPGYYITAEGFLDDNIVIQDSKYYQAFSYVIKSNILFETYKSVVKNLLHPSGTEIFGEYNIDIDINTNSSSSVIAITEVTYLNTESSSLIITENNNYLILE
jgi:hypothetical protein